MQGHFRLFVKKHNKTIFTSFSSTPQFDKEQLEKEIEEVSRALHIRIFQIWPVAIFTVRPISGTYLYIFHIYFFESIVFPFDLRSWVGYCDFVIRRWCLCFDLLFLFWCFIISFFGVDFIYDSISFLLFIIWRSPMSSSIISKSPNSILPDVWEILQWGNSSGKPLDHSFLMFSHPKEYSILGSWGLVQSEWSWISTH